ncbi:MAG: hypothetical protein M3Y27_31110, partial [Acidobacteriota bacterium]|nr:hypothetical protein [Acidobacteriota bacterium]
MKVLPRPSSRSTASSRRGGKTHFSGTEQIPPAKRKWFIALSVAATVVASAILFLDLASPRGVSVATLYVIPIILVQRATSALLTCLTAILCGILTSIG